MTLSSIQQNDDAAGVQLSRPPDQSPSLFTRYATGMIIGIILLIILINIGFLNTYTKYFPAFDDVDIPGYGPMHYDTVMHIHGMIMMAWVFMLLLQPVLIKSNKVRLHRQVGRLSYLLAPLVLLSIYVINQHAYEKVLKTAGQKEAIAVISLVFPAFVFFAILYFLAIFYRRTPQLHMRYMASTAFLFIPPAMDRTLIYYFNSPGYDTGSIIELVIIGAVTIYDSVKTRKISPFILVFAFETLHKILWHARETDFWQNLGGAIVKIF